MKLVLLTILALYITSQTYADGPPVDEDGNLFVMNIVFYFDSLQLEKIQYSSFFELNNDQMRILLKINPRFERKIFFISPFYNDCTCGMNYAIWNKEKSFAIPLYNVINEYEEYEEYEDSIYEESEVEQYKEKSYWDYDDTFGANVFIGVDANIYFNNKRISIEDFYLIVKGISERENKSYKFVTLRKPPKINSQIDLSVNELIFKIENITKKYAINFQISG